VAWWQQGQGCHQGTPTAVWSSSLRQGIGNSPGLTSLTGANPVTASHDRLRDEGASAIRPPRHTLRTPIGNHPAERHSELYLMGSL
jgi:hypothetical protein